MNHVEYEQIKAAIECMHAVEMRNGQSKGDFISRQNVLYILSKFVENQASPEINLSPEEQAACSSVPETV